jgi:hypothetical protein
VIVPSWTAAVKPSDSICAMAVRPAAVSWKSRNAVSICVKAAPVGVPVT